MTALDRLRRQCLDLVDRYQSDEWDDRSLLEQLLIDGPHMRPSGEVVGKVKPRSTPPGNLGARDLYDAVQAEAREWAWTLNRARLRPSRCLILLPDLAAQLDPGDDRLHGGNGLYAVVGHWHIKVRVALGYDRPADHYPSADCPSCHYRDDRGGSIRARETLAWCSNRECRDEHGGRREFSILYLQDLLRSAMELAT